MRTMRVEGSRQINQLIMLMSDLRSRDQEKYESLGKVTSEVMNHLKNLSKKMKQARCYNDC